jgi:hypothetical protein
MVQEMVLTEIFGIGNPEKKEKEKEKEAQRETAEAIEILEIETEIEKAIEKGMLIVTAAMLIGTKVAVTMTETATEKETHLDHLGGNAVVPKAQNAADLSATVLLAVTTSHP